MSSACPGQTLKYLVQMFLFCFVLFVVVVVAVVVAAAVLVVVVDNDVMGLFCKKGETDQGREQKSKVRTGNSTGEREGEESEGKWGRGGQ